MRQPLPGVLGHTGTGINQANMGNIDRHFWRSSEPRKSFKDQGNLSLTHIMIKVGLLIGNKGILSNYFSTVLPRRA